MKRTFAPFLFMAAILFATNPLFAGETKVGGVVFANWQLHVNDQHQGKSFNYFDITRARLILDQKFSDRYEANFMAEVFRSSYSGTEGMQFRLRSAYIQVNKLVPHTDMRFGMQGFYWLDKVEQYWGLRYIDPVSLDKLGYVSRADFGVGFIADCPGNYGYAGLQIVNGGGYTEGEKNKYKDFVGFLQGFPLPKDPDFGESGVMIQYYKGWPNEVDSATGNQSFAKNRRKDRLQIAGVVKYKRWGVAYAEFFTAWDKSDMTKDTTDIAKGVALFGRANVAASETWLSRVYIFAKYEWHDKHTQIDKGLDPFGAQNEDARYINAGIGYSPLDGYDLAVSIRRNTVNKREISQINEEESNTLVLSMQAKF